MAADPATLPPPVQQASSMSAPTRARFTSQPANTEPTGNGFRVHWARLKKKINSGSQDAPSESYIDDTLDGSSTWRRASDYPSSAGLYPTTSATNQAPAWNRVGGADLEPDEVDEIVVDNHFEGYNSGPDGNESHTGRSTSEKPFDPGSSSHNPHTDKESTNTVSIWDRYLLLTLLRWRLWPALQRFHSLSFSDPAAESQFSRESWYSAKPLAFWSGLWFILNWILACVLLPGELNDLDKVFYYCWLPITNVPVPLLVVFDWPRKRPFLYQCWITVTIWSWSFYNVLFMFLCGYYGSKSYFNCEGKDFTTVLYFATSYPALGLFALQWRRVPALIPPLFFVPLLGGVVIPYKHGWGRNAANILIFHIILLYIHYMRENAERRLYTLRDQVKLQYRATQKAQIAERKAGDSKRRLTSYVFHEVRVPLNTAMLALQNLEATLPQKDTDQAVELSALKASLSMMSKVLSDILDFNRMDAGRFESVSKPFYFHRVIRASMVGLQMAADAKGLELVTDFDRNIDLVARAASLREDGKSEEWINWYLAANPDEDAELMGDEMRLIQVVTNLTSNACKFTPPGPGGRVTVRTQLIYPSPLEPLGSESTAVVSEGAFPTANVTDDNEGTAVDTAGSIALQTLGYANGEILPPSLMPNAGTTNVESAMEEGLSVTRLRGHDRAMQSQISNGLNNLMPKNQKGQRKIVLRIEVHDTGVGIKPRDMIDNRLFSPYVQTEIGRHQGGKGTGLGLALVRHIVKLSGGRLGVKSKKEGGSCFWVEFPLGIVRPYDNSHRVDGLSTYPATPAPRADRNPVNKLSSDGSDRITPASEMTASSKAPSNFLELRGPTIPREMMDSVLDEEALPEHVAPVFNMISATPESLSSSAHHGTDVLTFQKSMLSPSLFSRSTLDSSKLVLPPARSHAVSTAPTSQSEPSRSTSPQVVSNLPSQPPENKTTSNPQISPPSSPTASDPFATPNATLRDSPSRLPTDGLSSISSARPGLIRLPTQPPQQQSEPMIMPDRAASDGLSTAAHTLGNALSSSSPTEKARRKSKDKEKKEMSSVRALVVDDDQLTRRLMERMLNRIGCVVETAENGHIALEMIKGIHSKVPQSDEPSTSSSSPSASAPDSINYDVVFLDNQMPVMSGVAMVRKLREEGRTDFIVGITGNALKEDQVEYMEAGLDQVLTKPVMEGSLKDMLRLALSRRQHTATSLSSPDPPQDLPT